MKKKILGIFIAIAVVSVGLFQVIPALADSAPPLDHVQILPVGTALAQGATQQFTAQGYSSTNVVIPDLTYFWMIVSGGGTINSNGVFKAGNTAGTFLNTVQVLAVQGSTVKLANANVTVNPAGAVGALDHVQVKPANRTVAPGGKIQFSAQGYDSANAAITGLTYIWSAAVGAGTIDTTGLFTAGTTTGTFTVSVQVNTPAGDVTKTGTATVIIKTNPAPETSAKFDIQKLAPLFKGYLGKVTFANFLGGQWQINNGSTVDTVKTLPGVVKAVSSNSITLLQNGQTATADFILESNVPILPRGTKLAVDDKVVVVTVNDQVKLVIKISAPSTSRFLPPGLKKQNDDKRDGKVIPPGWFQGKKTGWNND
jgi:hypothetical protein